MNRHPSSLLLVLAVGVLGGCASGPAHRTGGSLNASSPTGAAPTATVRTALQAATKQVIATEQAFATTMANRNFKAFLTFLSPDAIFFSGSMVEHGPVEIATQWAPYFDGRDAPFAWQPDHVEVVADGKLALSTGPLLQQGKIVGRFNSVWRLEAPNTWRIVFDKGEAVCSAPPTTNGSQFFVPPP